MSSSTHLPQLSVIEEVELPHRIYDVYRHGKLLVALMGTDGLAVCDCDRLVKTFGVNAEHLIPGPDPHQLLVLSEMLEPNCGPRHVHRLTLPSADGPPILEDLGVQEVQDWAFRHDGEFWAVLVHDEVRLLRLGRDHLTLEYRFQSFFTVYPEVVGDELYLETTSIGAAHYQVLSYPELELIREGDLDQVSINFPAECCLHVHHTPYWKESVFTTWPIPGQGGSHLRPRLINSSGETLTVLPNRSKGLVSDWPHALVWAPNGTRLEFRLVNVPNKRVCAVFHLDGVDEACARICDYHLAVGDANGRLRVFKMPSPHDSSRSPGP